MEAHRSPWLNLLIGTRVFGTTAAVLLLALHRVSPYDLQLIVAATVLAAVSIGAFLVAERLQRSPVVWLLDAGVALWLVWLSTDWRSPFYVLALTTLILPATTLRFRPAVTWGVGFAAAYLAVAFATERLPEETLRSTIRLETIATHVMVPVLVAVALAYASQALERLREERARAERLAIEAERQRIAWELHDSAKQRVHAAHLLLTALDRRAAGDDAGLLAQALGELQAASGDMDTSVAELRTPLEGRPVDRMLRERARELAAAGAVPICVRGRLHDLPPLVATHAYRIAAEAMTNAVRHAHANRVDVELEGDARPTIVVRDDGVGLPTVRRPGSHGMTSMHNRAKTIGARLDVLPAPSGRGTEVRLELPQQPTGGLT